MKKDIVILVISFLFIFPSLIFANPVKEIFEKASEAFSKGDYSKAIILYEESIKIYPLAPAYNYLGLCQREDGRHLTEVMRLFKKAIETDPEYAPAYNNLGKAYYVLGDLDKAEENILKAIELDPELLTARLSMGWIYLLGKSEPRDAMEYFGSVVEDNEIPYAYFGLGMAYFMDGQKHRTLEMITELRRIGREDFALQLEKMVRGGYFIPPEIGGKPLIMPRL